MTQALDIEALHKEGLMESLGQTIFILLGVVASIATTYLVFRAIRKQLLHVVGTQDVIVVTSNKEPNRILTRFGQSHWQNPFNQSVRRISWTSDPRDIDITRAGDSILLKFKVDCITQERLKSSLSPTLNIRTEESFESLLPIYDAWKAVVTEAEHAIHDFVSTLSVGEIRPQRHTLQTEVYDRISQSLEQYGINLSKVAISPNILFEADIEATLAQEANVRLIGRAELAKAEIANTISEEAVASEVKNRKALAQADAESIAFVIPELQDPKEAARFIVLMRYAYELSRFGPGGVEEVSFSKLLDTIRELLSPTEAMIVEEVKTSTSSRPRTN